MIRYGRIRRATALTVVAALGLLVTAGPAMAYTVDVTDNATATTYDVCVHPWIDPDSYDPPCTQTIATASSGVSAVPYRVTASVTFGNATDTTFVMAEILCKLGSTVLTGTSAPLPQYQNLLVSESITLTPTLVVSPGSGTLNCDLLVRGTKTTVTNETYRVQSGWIHITGPFDTDSTNVRLATPQTLSSGNPTIDIYVQNYAVTTSWTTARLYGQAYVSTTGSSSDFTAQLIFAEYPFTGGVYCRKDSYPTTAPTYHITSTRQHYTVYQYQAFTKTAACQNSIKAILRLQYVSGASLTVSDANSLLALPIE